MWYLKVSQNLFIAVALICMIQNAISFAIDPKATENEWDKLAESTEQKDLKTMTVKCKQNINTFNEKLENMKTSTNKKLIEPNKTTDDIVNLASDVKSQVNSASTNIVILRKIVQKMAFRFRDSFKSLESFTEIDHESLNEDLKNIENTAVDNRKPLVRNTIRSFGNRYDLSKLANKILKIASDGDKSRDNYDDKRKFAKQEFSTLWNALKRHSKSINNDALDAMKIFIDGLNSVKTIKKKVKNDDDDALDKEKGGKDVEKLKNAVELAKALKLKFKDDLELGSGEMNYSQEEKKEVNSDINEKIPNDSVNYKPQSLDDNLKNNLQPGFQEKKLDETITNNKMDETQSKSQEKIKDPTITSPNYNNINNSSENTLPNNEDKSSYEVNTAQSEIQNSQQDPITNISNNNNDENEIEQNKPTVEEAKSIEETTTQPTLENISNNNKEGNETEQKIPNVEDAKIIEETNTQPTIENNQQETTEKSPNSNDKENLIQQTTDKVEDPNNIEENNPQTKSQSNQQNSAEKSSKPNKVNSPNTNKNQVKQTVPMKNQKGTRKVLNKKKEKIPLLTWTQLIKQKDPQISDQSKTCRNRIQNTLKELDTIKIPVKNAIQNVKNNSELEKNKNDILQQFYDKMIDTSKTLKDSLVNATEDVCEKVMPLNNRYEIKFKNDPYIKRIEYFLSKRYDPHQCMLDILKSTKNTSEYPQKEIYKKILSLSNNLTHKTKEMENAALYAMNKINEGKSAAKELKKMFNKEKASKACYIRNLLLEKEDEEEKKRKDKNKKKLNENLIGTKQKGPINPNINLDSIEIEDQSPEEDDEKQLMDDEEQNKLTNIFRDSTDHEIKNEEHEDIQDDSEKDVNENEEPVGSKNNPNTESPRPYNSDASDADNIPENKKPIKRVKKVIDPETGNELFQEYEDSEENPEKDVNENKEPEEHEDIEDDPENEVNVNEEPKDSNNNPNSESPIPANSDASDADNILKNKKPIKGVKKVIDPETGNELFQEYEDSEENPEKDVNEYKEPEEHEDIEDDPENEVIVNEEPKDSNNPISESPIPVNSDASDADNILKNKKPMKRVKKVIDPETGNKLFQEYEDSEENPEKDVNENKEPEEHEDIEDDPENEVNVNEEPKDSNNNPISESPIPANSDASDADNIPKNKKPMKRVKKVIDPETGNKLFQEYEDSEENPEKDVNENKEPEEHEDIEDDPENEVNVNEEPKDSNNNPISESPIPANSDASDADNIPKNKKPNKRVKKVIDPETGNELFQEYEDSEENPENESPILANSDASDADNIPENKKPIKRVKKVIDPETGNELFQEYEDSEENPEKDVNENKEPEEHEDIEDDPENEVNVKEEPKDSNNNPNSESPIPANSDASDADNIPKNKKPNKRVKKIIDPETGNELFQEYEDSEENPENESPILANSDASDADNIPENKKPIKRVKKVIDPETGNELFQEYEDSEENPEKDVNENKEPEEHEDIEDDPENEVNVNEEPKDSNNNPISESPIPANSDASDADNILKNKKPMKRVKKVIDPETGNKLFQEYEDSEENPEIDVNKNKELEEHEDIEDDPENEVNVNEEPKDSNNNPISESPIPANSDASDADNIPKNKKPNKRVKKVIDPETGNELFQEYEDSEENLENESPIPANSDASDADNIPENKKPIKGVKKVINPETGNELFQEYEDSEENPEKDVNENKEPEEHEDIEDDPENEVNVKEEPKDSNNNPNSESLIPANSDASDADNIPKNKKPNKRVKKVIDPETGNELSQEYEDSEENLKNESPIPANSDASDADNIPENKKPIKGVKKVIDPETGNELFQEYEDSEENPEKDVNEYKEPEEHEDIEDDPENEVIVNEEPKDSNNPISESPIPVNSDASDADNILKNKKPMKRVKKVIDPETGNKLFQEYEDSEENTEKDVNENKEPEEHEDIEDDPENEVNVNEEPKDSNNNPISESPIPANSDASDADNIPKNKKPMKRVKKVIDPETGNKLFQEYEDSEENPEKDVNENKEPEEHEDIEDDPENEVNVNEEPKDSNNNPISESPIPANSDASDADNIPKNKKPNKRVKKVIDPETGNELFQEYEDSEENPENESPILANSDASDADNIPENKKPIKRVKKVIDPETGNELFQEYEDSEENPEKDVNENKEPEEHEDIEDDPENEVNVKEEPKDSNNNPNSESPIPANSDASDADNIPKNKKPNKLVKKVIDPETGNELFQEYEDSEENPENESPILANSDASDADNIPENKKPIKRVKKVIDPETGNELFQEYEDSEENPEKDVNENKEPEEHEDIEDDPENEVNVNEEPKDSNNNPNSESPIPANSDASDADNILKNKKPMKRVKKVIDPETGNKLFQEYEDSEENPEKDVNENKEPEEHENIEDDPENEVNVNEEPKDSNNNPISESPIPANSDASDADNIPKNKKPNKRVKKVIDPETGNELFQEYEDSEENLENESPIPANSDASDADNIPENKKPIKGVKKVINPETGNELFQEYEDSEENPEKDVNENKEPEEHEDIEDDPENEVNVKEEPKDSNNNPNSESPIPANSDASDADNIPKNKKPNKRVKKVIDPETGNELFQEYEDSEENPENESPILANSDASDADNIPENKKPIKRVKKVIDPETGNELFQEYEDSEENPEKDVNENKEPEEHEDIEDDPENEVNVNEEPKDSNNNPNSESPIPANSDASDADNILKNKKPMKRVKKVFDPVTGNELSQEYEDSEENLKNESPIPANSDASDADNIPENKKPIKGVKKVIDPETGNELFQEYEESEENPENESPIPANSDASDADNIPKNKKPIKRVKKVIDPETGNELFQEYEDSEENFEKDVNEYKEPEEHEDIEDDPENEVNVNEEPKDSNNPISEYPIPANSDGSDADNILKNKKPMKRVKKVFDPETGNDIFQDYEDSEENPENESPIPANSDASDADNIPENKKPIKRVKKVIDPETGNELFQEYEDSEENPEKYVNEHKEPEEHKDIEYDPDSKVYENKEPEDHEDTEDDPESEVFENEEPLGSNNNPITESPIPANKVGSDADNISTNKKPTRRVSRKVIDPKTENVLSEEFEESEEVPDDEYEHTLVPQESYPLSESLLNDSIGTSKEPVSKHHETAYDDEPINSEIVPNSFVSVPTKNVDFVTDNIPTNKKPSKYMRKVIDPKTGNELSEEYDEFEDDPESEIDDYEEPIESENNPISESPIPANLDVSDANNIPKNKKPSRYMRKVIDPETGNELSEEYEVIEDDPESDVNENKEPGDHEYTEDDPESEVYEYEETLSSNNNPITESPIPADKVDSDADNIPKNKKPSRYMRKVIDPETGNELSEEYEVTEDDPESDVNENKEPGDHEDTEDDPENEVNVNEEPKDSNNNPISESPTPANLDSSDADNISTNKKPTRRVSRNVIYPKTGNVLSEEFEESEEVPDDEYEHTLVPQESYPLPEPLLNGSTGTIKEPVSKHHETAYDDEPIYSEIVPNSVDSVPTKNVDFDSDNIPTNKKPSKYMKKVIDPKTGNELSEEYDEFDDDPESEIDDYEEPIESENNPISESPIPANSDASDADNIPKNKKPSRYMRKVIDPETGNELSEEYEVTEDDPESDVNENKEPGDHEDTEDDPENEVNVNEEPKDSNKNPISESPTPANLDSSDADNISTNKKPTRRVSRKVIDPKTGNVLSEEFEESEDVPDDEYEHTLVPQESYPIPEPLLNGSTGTIKEPVSKHHETAYDDEPIYSEIVPNSVDSVPTKNVDFDSDNIPTNKKPSKYMKKVIDPKTGNELSEEYDEFDDDPESEIDDYEEPIESENNPISESPIAAETVHSYDDNILMTEKPARRIRKFIEPESGNEVSEEYHVTEEVPFDESNMSYEPIMSDSYESYDDTVRNPSVNADLNIIAMNKKPVKHDRKFKDSDDNPNESASYINADNYNMNNDLSENVKPFSKISEEYEESQEIDEVEPEENSNLINKNNYPDYLNPSQPLTGVHSNSKEETDDNNDNYNNYNNNNPNSEFPFDRQESDLNPDGFYNDNNHEIENNEVIDNNQSDDIDPLDDSKYPKMSDLLPEDSLHPIDIDRQRIHFDNGKQLPKKSMIDNEQFSEPIDDNDTFPSDFENSPNSFQDELQEQNTNEPLESSEVNETEYEAEPDLSNDSKLPSEDEHKLNDDDDDELNDKDRKKKKNLRRKKRKNPKKKKYLRRKKSIITNSSKKKKTTTEDSISEEVLINNNNNIDFEDSSFENQDNENSNAIKPKPKKKKRVKVIRRYLVDKETNEKIPISDDLPFNTNLFETSENPQPFNTESQPEDSKLDNSNMKEENSDDSAFLFNEYNADQCKRDAFDRFKKVISEDFEQTAYECVLDTSKMRSFVLDTIKNAIINVKYAKTSKDVDQSIRRVSYILKNGLKQTISDLVTKILPLINRFLNMTEYLKVLYEKGPQTTHSMLTSVLEIIPSIRDSDDGIVKLISVQLDIDELIDNIFENQLNARSLRNKKAEVQRKFIELSKNMDTAVSNIDCYVLSALSTIGIGSNALKLLRPGRMIMSENHPRTKTLKDAISIIKSIKKVLENNRTTRTLNTDYNAETNDDKDENDNDDDSGPVAKKNEEFLKTVPNLNDNVSLQKNVPNERKSFGVIVIHPNSEVEYREVSDPLELKQFVGDRMNKYLDQSESNRPKFLKVNSKKLVKKMVANVKKEAEKNGMSNREMVDHIVNTLKKNRS